MPARNRTQRRAVHTPQVERTRLQVERTQQAGLMQPAPRTRQRVERTRPVVLTLLVEHMQRAGRTQPVVHTPQAEHMQLGEHMRLVEHMQRVELTQRRVVRATHIRRLELATSA
jgi:hypothetical protein